MRLLLGWPAYASRPQHRVYFPTVTVHCPGLCYTVSPSSDNGSVPQTLSDVYLPGHIQAGRLSSMPVAMLHSARLAAVYLVKGTSEAAGSLWRPLDQVLSALITGFKSSMCVILVREVRRISEYELNRPRSATSVHSDAQLYLLCLSVLSAAIVEQNSPISMPLISALCKCTEHALTDRTEGVGA